MTDKPVVVYGASGYTGRLICEYLREYNVPFVAAGRSEDKLTRLDGQQRRRHRDRRLRGRRGRARRRRADRPVQGRVGRAATPSGRSASYGPEVVEACLAAGAHYLDTTGEQDWLITCDEKYGADFAAAGLLLVAGRRADVHHRRDRRPALPRDARASTPSTSRCSGAAARRSRRRRRSWSTPRCPRPTTSSRTPTRSGTPRPGSTSSPSPASTSSRWPCPGAARRTRSGSSATRAWRTARRSAASSTRALMLGVPQIVAAAIEATKDMDARRPRTPRSRRPPPR